MHPVSGYAATKVPTVMSTTASLAQPMVSCGAVSQAVSIPVVASGGAGKPEHLVDAILKGKADAALAASIFHFGHYTIEETKRTMAAAGIPVRLPD